jgi:hypothetical protein
VDWIKADSSGMLRRNSKESGTDELSRKLEFFIHGWNQAAART